MIYDRSFFREQFARIALVAADVERRLFGGSAVPDCPICDGTGWDCRNGKERCGCRKAVA